MKQSTIYYSKKYVFDAVKMAAKNLDLKVETSSAVKGALSLYSDGGLLSFGNTIEVSIKASGTHKSLLTVTSKSSAIIQVIDWGTNENLENNLIEEVKNILS